MDKRKFKELTGLTSVKITVNDETLKALLEQDKNNPNGAKAGFVARMIIEQAVKQGLLPQLVNDGRKSLYERVP